jgi:fatty acid elongase 3
VNSHNIVQGTLVGYMLISYALNFLLGERKEGHAPNTLYYKVLKYMALLHNFNMMAISLVAFAGLAYEAGSLISSHGWYVMICDPEHKYITGKAAFWMYIYYVSKYVELFDTVLLVLRRSQLRFIHTYHHVTTMTITYLGLYTRGTGQWVIILLNVFVHVVMYYYYIQVTLGNHVSWKMRLTDLQLAQFILDCAFFTYYIYAELYYERPRGGKCSGSLPGAILSDLIVASFFILFFRLRQANLRAAEKRRMLLKNKKVVGQDEGTEKLKTN